MRAHKLDAFLAFYFNRNVLKTVLLYASINLVVHRAGFEPAIFILVEMIGLEPTNSTLSEWRVNQLHHISIFVKIYKILAILCFDVCKNR